MRVAKDKNIGSFLVCYINRFSFQYLIFWVIRSLGNSIFLIRKAEYQRSWQGLSISAIDRNSRAYIQYRERLVEVETSAFDMHIQALSDLHMVWVAVPENK